MGANNLMATISSLFCTEFSGCLCCCVWFTFLKSILSYFSHLLSGRNVWIAIKHSFQEWPFCLCPISDRTRSRQQVQQYTKAVCWSSVPGKVLMPHSAPWDVCCNVFLRPSRLLSIFKASSLQTEFFFWVPGTAVSSNLAVVRAWAVAFARAWISGMGRQFSAAGHSTGGVGSTLACWAVDFSLSSPAFPDGSHGEDVFC